MSQIGRSSNGHGVMYGHQDQHPINKKVGLAAAAAPVPMPTPLAPPPLRTHPYQAGSGFQESVTHARPDAAPDGLDGWAARGPEVENLSHFVDNGYHYEGDPTMLSSSAPVQSPGGDLQNPAAEGMVIQSYITLDELGFGGAGKAFLVKGKVDGKHYVSKQINCLGKEYKAAPASYALHETRLLFMLRHPHIVQLKDFYPKSSNYFIVMEFCENGDLGNLIEKAIRGGGVRFDTERIFTWWYQILDGVDYCHSKGVIHRDLKPKNIFIDSGHNVKIGDFGVSALTSFPQATERVGTVRYHAPEVVSSLLYTFKSDVWSIGCIMWEVIALRPPSKEPINLQNIDLSLIPKVYGSATRDLLLLHLQHLDHRPSVSAIKKAMLSNLASAGRQLVQSVADASASMQHASEREASALMAPRHVAAPLKISDAASRDANGQSSAVVGPGLSGDKVKIASTSSHGGGHNPSPVVGQKSISDSSDASGGLGIHLAAGEGGEYGAWKIVLLPPGKPAALSGDVSIGDYLWEVNGKVTFGMPYDLIIAMFNSRTGPTKIGLKRGLGLPIRHVVLSCENVQQGGEAKPWVQQGGEAKPWVEHDDSHDVSRTGEDTVESLGPAEHAVKISHPPEPKTDALARTPPSASLQTCGANAARKHEMSESQSGVQVSSNNREADTSGYTVKSGGSISRKMDSSDAEPTDINLSPNLGTASVPHHETVQALGSNGKTGTDGAGSSGECTIAGNGHYAGELVNGRPEGKGKATWPKQGHTYIGEWRNGVMHGQGSATYLNGDRYDGEWSMGKRCGLGRYTHGSGDVYEGLWSNERKHGLGVDNFVDGRGYYGEFSDNKFAGIGTYYTGDGAIYQGQWRTGKAHGVGFSTSSQGGVPSFVQYSHGNLVESEIFEPSLHQEQQLNVQRQSRAALAVALLARRVASSILGVAIDGPQVMGGTEPEPAPDHVIASPDALAKAIYILTGVKTDRNMVIQDVDDETSSSHSSSKAYADGDSILEICRRSSSWFIGMPLQDILSWLQTQMSSEEQAPTLEIGIKTQGAQQWFVTSRVRLAARDHGFIV